MATAAVVIPNGSHVSSLSLPSFSALAAAIQDFIKLHPLQAISIGLLATVLFLFGSFILIDAWRNRKRTGRFVQFRTFRTFFNRVLPAEFRPSPAIRTFINTFRRAHLFNFYASDKSTSDGRYPIREVDENIWNTPLSRKERWAIATLKLVAYLLSNSVLVYAFYADRADCDRTLHPRLCSAVGYIHDVADSICASQYALTICWRCPDSSSEKRPDQFLVMLIVTCIVVVSVATAEKLLVVCVRRCGLFLSTCLRCFCVSCCCCYCFCHCCCNCCCGMCISTCCMDDYAGDGEDEEGSQEEGTAAAALLVSMTTSGTSTGTSTRNLGKGHSSNSSKGHYSTDIMCSMLSEHTESLRTAARENMVEHCDGTTPVEEAEAIALMIRAAVDAGAGAGVPQATVEQYRDWLHVGSSCCSDVINRPDAPRNMTTIVRQVKATREQGMEIERAVEGMAAAAQEEEEEEGMGATCRRSRGTTTTGLDGEDQDVFLFKAFLAYAMRGHLQRQVAKTVLFPATAAVQLDPPHSNNTAKSAGRCHYYISFLICLILAAYLFYSYGLIRALTNKIEDEGAVWRRRWIATLAGALLIDALWVQPAVLWMQVITLPQLARKQFLSIFLMLWTKRWLLLREERSGISGAMEQQAVQRCNPACRASRRLPGLSAARMLMSLKDCDMDYARALYDSIHSRNYYFMTPLLYACSCALALTLLLPQWLHRLLLEIMLTSIVLALPVVVYFGNSTSWHMMVIAGALLLVVFGPACCVSCCGAQRRLWYPDADKHDILDDPLIPGVEDCAGADWGIVDSRSCSTRDQGMTARSVRSDGASTSDLGRRAGVGTAGTGSGARGGCGSGGGIGDVLGMEVEYRSGCPYTALVDFAEGSDVSDEEQFV